MRRFVLSCLPSNTLWFPDALSGRALALYSTAPSVGSLLGNLSSGWLLGALDGTFGISGWRWLLLVQVALQ